MLRRAPPGPGVLRGADRRQPGPGPPGARRGAVQALTPRPQGRNDQAGGVFKTAIDRSNQGVTINAFWRHSRVKQYLKDGRALRIETVVNSPDDLGCRAACTTSPNCRPGPVRSTPGCWTLKKPARDVSSIVQPLRGYRSPPSPRMAGGPQDYGSATLESWPWPAPWPTAVRRHRHHQQEPARLDDRPARHPLHGMNQASYDRPACPATA